MKQRSNSELARLLKQLQLGEFTGNIYSLLHEFGEADFQEAVQTVEGYLTNSNAELRFIALSVLVLHWRRPEYRNAAERMLSDHDADVRRMAADALGVLSQNTRDARVFSLLLARIDDSAEEWHVRDTAYEAIQKALGQTPDYSRLGKPMTWPDEARPDVIAEARAIAENST